MQAPIRAAPMIIRKLRCASHAARERKNAAKYRVYGTCGVPGK
ncbi:MAG: hypothetical protein ACRC10_10320 [Thermoguttaceae bacterium]